MGNKFEFKDIKELCEYYTRHIVFNIPFIKQIESFRLAWVQKGDEYIDFLGSNFIGAHTIRFSARDENTLWVDILNIDMESFAYDLIRVPGINKNFKTISNPTLQILVYLMHRFSISDLKDNIKQTAIENIYSIFAYKVLGSLYSHYFNYKVEEGIAKIVFEKMSNKFLIKKMHWQDVILYRAKDLLKGGLHYNRLTSYKTEEAIWIINDLETRLRDIIKNAYKILIKVNEDGIKIKDSSMLETIDDNTQFKEFINNPTKYVIYLRNIINQPTEFVREDLVDLIRDDAVLPAIQKDIFLQIINYISSEIEIIEGSKNDFIEMIVVDSLAYLRRKNMINNLETSLLPILVTIRNYWSSSTADKGIVKDIKKELTRIAIEATGRRTGHIVATYVIGVIIYTFLRGLIRK